MGFFVGQVMKRSQGKADPKGVQPVLAEKLK
jgi:Asp-tRNA(Asn)/Glu-tRNA(Gln) amidotransferase B subunit